MAINESDYIACDKTMGYYRKDLILTMWQGHRILKKNKNAFTLIELMTSIMILGISIVLFNTIFVSSWISFEERVLRSKLWQETNDIIERITYDARDAYSVELVEDEDSSLIKLYDKDSTLISSYLINSQGTVQISKSEEDEQYTIISESIDFLDSDFNVEAGATTLYVKLTLQDYVFTRLIEVETSTEIFLRNS